MTRRDADWLDLTTALDRILGAVPALPAERVTLLDALGRTLAEDIVSPIDQPPWDNSAMDGFAVRSADVRGASEARPVELRVVEEIAAGAFPSRPLAAGEAARIMTGAPVPEGADGVIRIEHTDAWGAPASAGGARVRIRSDADAGRNVRARGEDLRRGEVVLDAGAGVGAATLGVLATVGAHEVGVARRPVVGILSNGDELADLRDYDQVLAGRKIVNSNSYGLHGAVRAAGGEPILLGIARDDAADIRERIGGAGPLDALITSAGAAVGDHDLVKDVLDGLGFELDFWRVKIRPGSPFSFGRLGGVPVFGVAGNPVSALVTFEILVRPALLRMQGRSAVHPATVRVRVAERIAQSAGLVRFLRARTQLARDGVWEARLTGPQGSGILRSMAEADVLLVVPLDVEVVEAGEWLTAVVPGAAPQATRGF